MTHDIAQANRRRILQLGAGFGAMTAGSGLLGQAQAQSARADSFNWTLHKPETVGLSSAGVAKINDVIQGHIDRGELTGAVTVLARRGKLIHYQAHGIRDIETKAPMRTNDIFRMMSSTKPTIGVAALMMMEEGKLSIDDKVSRFIPEFRNTRVAVLPAGANLAAARTPEARAALAAQVSYVPASRELTVKDFMTHTSGLSSGGAGGLVNRIQRQPGDTLATYIPRLGAAALDFQPGTQWNYSASDGIDVLARIVEVCSGMPIDVFLRERLYQPLDMRDTYFNVPAVKRERILTLYDRQGSNWRPARAAFGYAPTVYFSGAGGTMSTAHDSMQFEEMLLNKGSLNGKRVLKPESVALMAANATGDLYDGTSGTTKGTGFGLTVRVVKDPVAAKTGRAAGAFGWGGAYGTCSWTDPQEQITAALMIQQPVGAVLTNYENAIRAAIVA